MPISEQNKNNKNTQTTTVDIGDTEGRNWTDTKHSHHFVWGVVQVSSQCARYLCQKVTYVTNLHNYLMQRECFGAHDYVTEKR